MPPLPPAPQVIRAQYHFTIGEDSQARCRQFIAYTGSSPSSSDLGILAGDFAGNFLANLVPLMTADRVLTEITLTDLTSATSGNGQWVGSHPGTLSSPELPADVCVLQSLEIARRFRGGHARTYWPFFGQAEQHDAQTWSATPLGNLETAFDAFMSANNSAFPIGTISSGLVVVSYYQGFTVHTGTTGRARNVSTVRSTTLLDPVQSRVFRAGIASQRKRLLRLA